jgi:hypothetical protein
LLVPNPNERCAVPLPGKNDKSYLGIVPRGRGFAIPAAPQHAAELLPLFTQYGISCRREADVLVFAEGADRGKVQEIVDGYELAKGS